MVSVIISFVIPSVVIDEAHYIKEHLTKSAKACFALAAEKRWVLTGTPIVNRLEDLFSLVHFIRLEPVLNLIDFSGANLPFGMHL